MPRRGGVFFNVEASPQRSLLAQQLLAQSLSNTNRGSRSFAESAAIAAPMVLGALLNKKEQQAQQKGSQALAGALARANAPADPSMASQLVMPQENVQKMQAAKQEAAKRAALMIAGGNPQNPIAQQIMSQQAQSAFAPSGAEEYTLGPGQQRMRGNQVIASVPASSREDGGIGVVPPERFTTESVAKFQKTHNYGDLVFRDDRLGRINLGLYTPDSIQAAVVSGDYGLLELRPNYVTSKDPAGGTFVVDKNSGQKGPTALSAEDATQLAGELARVKAESTALGEATGKIMAKAKQGQGINELLDLAEPLLDVATGSGAGTATNKVQAFFGYAPTGAQAIGQLQTLQAALILGMPRLEGPQSDKDRELYIQAAGQIGDPKIPREIKKAAVQTIRDIQQRYANVAASMGAQPGAPKPLEDPLGIRKP